MILDIALIVLTLAVIFIGYKVGFLTTFVKLASMVSGIIVAFLLTEPVTNKVCEWGWDDGISDNIYNNITSADAFQEYYANGGGQAGISAILTELGIPEFLSEFVAGELISNIDAEGAARAVSEGISRAASMVVVFIGLLIFSSLFFFILKLVIKALRKTVGLIRILDGLLGVVFFLLVFLILLYIGLLVVSLVMQSLPPDHGFVMFMKEQLKIGSEEFGIVKYLYENNLIGNIVGLLL